MKKIKIIAGGGLVSNENNELLMIFRREKWDLPKGKQDDDESIEACAIREVQEETGLTDIHIGSLTGITFHEYFDERFTKKNVLKESHWFAMSVKGVPRLIPQTAEDIEKAEWCNEEKVSVYLQNSYPNIIEIVQKWRGKV